MLVAGILLLLVCKALLFKSFSSVESSPLAFFVVTNKNDGVNRRIGEGDTEKASATGSTTTDRDISWGRRRSNLNSKSMAFLLDDVRGESINRFELHTLLVD